MSEPARERIVIVTSSYPAHPDDPSGHFVAADVARLSGAGHEVVVLAPRTTRKSLEIFGPKPPYDSVAGPAGERIVWLSAGDAFGWPGVVPRLRERKVRALGVLSFVRNARAFLRVSSLHGDPSRDPVLGQRTDQLTDQCAYRGPWNRLVAHFVLPSVWPILDGLEPPAPVLEAVAHGSDVRLAARLPGVLRRRMARALAPFTVRTTSEELRNELARTFGAELARRVRVEPAPLDMPPSPGRANARRELGVAASERLLVVVGRLVREKRVDVALRAARLVPGASAVVVGDGPERAALERDFPSARFVGLVGRARALRWLAAADALLLASREEGAPSVVREARALGTPVVALPSGDLRAWQASDPGLFVVPAWPPP